jgi:hypothetical protein
MRRQSFSESLRICLCLSKSEWQRSQTAQREIGLHGTWRSAERSPHGIQRFKMLWLV